MTRYNYEALTDQTFQKFAQALILIDHPDTQCLPVGQPDGGRDAFFVELDQANPSFVVFQVKFSRGPSSKDDREAIKNLIKSEKQKVARLIQRGATHYYFVTNVQGTAHLDTGSIDQANTILASEFGIPSRVWWRDDLDARLDNAIAVKFSYPEILTGKDALLLLAGEHADQRELHVRRVLTSYIAAQRSSDSEVRFKQANLKWGLTQLYVDLPLGKKGPQNETSRTDGGSRLEIPKTLDQYIGQLDIDEDDDYEFEEPHLLQPRKQAAAFLLQMPICDGVTRLILQGAPGQGKSTVTQFVCQVNRLRILARMDELRGVADSHKCGPARVPFRIDLPRYAKWLAGANPFAKNEAAVPAEGHRSLESFLVRHVASDAGMGAVTHDDLIGFLAKSHSLIVLDGFDEVADISMRTEVMEEICKASERLGAHALSLQIIITSRPAAFANSAGFPERDWIHLELKDMAWSNIETYKNKWLESREFPTAEAEKISAVLETKIDEPHVRDLARSPMQLAILLHLIHNKGPSLPDKRTTLYEKYMEVFFDREAEKSDIVQQRRDLLLAVHGAIAWLIQTQVETAAGSGSVGAPELRAHVKQFLELGGHKAELLDGLFKGMVQRVGVLVSRVEGTFEFEVQPLREYFVARHLYKTAPYSPQGAGCRGTRPDRFDALARNAYWTNVTRFFCGFFDVGELGTLVDGVQKLGEQGEYRLVNQARRVALMILGDWVFSESPIATRRLVKYIAEEPGFARLTARDARFETRGLGVAEPEAREALFGACSEKLDNTADGSRRRLLREALAELADERTLKQEWTRRYRNGLMDEDPLAEAADFGILRGAGTEEIAALCEGNGELRARWLARIGQHGAIAAEEKLYESVCSAYFSGENVFRGRRLSNRRAMLDLQVLQEVLRTHRLARVLAPLGAGKNGTVLENIVGPNARTRGEWKLYGCPRRTEVTEFANFVLEHLDCGQSELRSDLGAWSTLLDRGLEIAPESVVFWRIAAVVSAVAGDRPRGHSAGFGLHSGQDLIGLLAETRQKCGNGNWWREALSAAGSSGRPFGLAVLLSWGPMGVLEKELPMVVEMVEGMNGKEWTELRECFMSIASAAGNARPGVTAEWCAGNCCGLARVAVLLSNRVYEFGARRRVSRQLLKGCVGEDGWIIRRAGQREMAIGQEEDIDWEFVEELSKLGRGSGVGSLAGGRIGRWTVPSVVAKRVLEECEKHCEEMVAVCESTHSVAVAKRGSKVAEIAEQEQWFRAEAE